MPKSWWETSSWKAAGPGALLGEMALIDNSPRTASVGRKNAVPAGASRPAQVPFSCAADATFRNPRDENVGRSSAPHERDCGRQVRESKASFAVARLVLWFCRATSFAMADFRCACSDRLRSEACTGCRSCERAQRMVQEQLVAWRSRRARAGLRSRKSRAKSLCPEIRAPPAIPISLFRSVYGQPFPNRTSSPS